MSVLNHRAEVEVLQKYIGTAQRSEPLLCPDFSSITIANLSINYLNSVTGIFDFTWQSA